MTWTEEQVRALVTDAGTLKRGQELAGPAKWGNLGQTSTAAWGECAGSGSKPYQTGIDLTEPAFKCSCPSRVFPCKHGVGLLLLMARQPDLLTGSAPPAWLTEWLGKRQTRQQDQVEKAVSKAESPPADPAAREKRESQRLQRMERSAAELEAWLLDLIRSGLGTLEKQPDSYWETQAARLVDGQLPGLAAVVRELADVRHSGPDWTARLLARLGELYLLVRAFQNLPALSAAARQEVLQQVGIALKKEDLLAAGTAVSDTWDVAGQLAWEDDRLTARRTWLWGQQTRRFALVLEYAFGGQSFATSLVPGARYEGTVVYYPGLHPLRVLPVQLAFQGPGPEVAVLAPQSPARLLTEYADALSQNPWLREWPVALGEVRPVLLPTGTWVLQHAADGQLPLLADAAQAWQLVAISGGRPITVFGEWTGRSFQLLAYETDPVAPNPPRP